MEKAIIIGAGPAGLTAAYELIKQTEIKPIVIEMTNDIGGISKTVNYKGNRIDIGGHRFFSKSDAVMEWWQSILPIDNSNKNSLQINYQNKSKTVKVKDRVINKNKVLLIRNRISRIFFLQKFFKYPINLSFQTLYKLGFLTSVKISFSYISIRLFPIKNEQNLEQFFINRFGKVLYRTFFKDYTEKVWGKKCNQIPSEWGKQRIKGVSISKAIKHAISKRSKDVSQKNTETSLIEKFLYPKFGPGQLWEEVADIIECSGGEIIKNTVVTKLVTDDNLIKKVFGKNSNTSEKFEFQADYVISTMPIKDLVNSFNPKPQINVLDVANKLEYRDFITVGLLLNKMKLTNKSESLIKDNWIYIQEKTVKLGRLQIFNNWSPHLVKNQETIWLGLEYFCNEGDELWSKTDEDFIKFAIEELSSINIIEKEDVLDATIIKMPKTYPSYFGSYSKLDIVKNFTNKFENLFLIGRNGMHKYNNQDHSMLTAMEAVKNIKNNITSKDNIWAINTEQEYHEEK